MSSSSASSASTAALSSVVGALTTKKKRKRAGDENNGKDDKDDTDATEAPANNATPPPLRTIKEQVAVCLDKLVHDNTLPSTTFVSNTIALIVDYVANHLLYLLESFGYARPDRLNMWEIIEYAADNQSSSAAAAATLPRFIRAYNLPTPIMYCSLAPLRSGSQWQSVVAAPPGSNTIVVSYWSQLGFGDGASAHHIQAWDLSNNPPSVLKVGTGAPNLFWSPTYNRLLTYRAFEQQYCEYVNEDESGEWSAVRDHEQLQRTLWASHEGIIQHTKPTDPTDAACWVGIWPDLRLEQQKQSEPTIFFNNASIQSSQSTARQIVDDQKKKAKEATDARTAALNVLSHIPEVVRIELDRNAAMRKFDFDMHKSDSGSKSDLLDGFQQIFAPRGVSSALGDLEPPERIVALNPMASVMQMAPDGDTVIYWTSTYPLQSSKMDGPMNSNINPVDYTDIKTQSMENTDKLEGLLSAWSISAGRQQWQTPTIGQLVMRMIVNDKFIVLHSTTKHDRPILSCYNTKTGTHIAGGKRLNVFPPVASIAFINGPDDEKAERDGDNMPYVLCLFTCLHSTLNNPGFPRLDAPTTPPSQRYLWPMGIWHPIGETNVRLDMVPGAGLIGAVGQIVSVNNNSGAFVRVDNQLVSVRMQSSTTGVAHCVLSSPFTSPLPIPIRNIREPIHECYAFIG